MSFKNDMKMQNSTSEIISKKNLNILKENLIQIKEAIKDIEDAIEIENPLEYFYSLTAKLEYSSEYIHDIAKELNDDIYYYLVNGKNKKNT